MREQLTDLNVPADFKRIPGQNPSETSTRLRFTKQCELYDRGLKGIIKLQDLQSAFVAAKIQPPPTLAQTKKLVNALEAWHQMEHNTVQYKNFLDGRRGNISVYGIFPKTVPRQAALKAEEEKKAKEKEEERKKKAAEEEIQRQKE